MPAFSFNERFVPMVKDGSKPGTIRAFRKYPIQVGQLAHLFFGMRTKYCTKLVAPAPVIHTVNSLIITAGGVLVVFGRSWIAPEDRAGLIQGMAILDTDAERILTERAVELNEFAWRDGFRHADAPDRREGCYGLMLTYWRETTGLPFIGNHIMWGK